ncbi:hypothetical protein [Shewanella sp.]|uniref:hypothetical protein n=1 Tax=Shewanella sp. TaxID=50422 RepID=UPI003A97238A
MRGTFSAVLNLSGLAILPQLDVTPYLATKQLAPTARLSTARVWHLRHFSQPLALKLRLEAVSDFLRANLSSVT